MCTGMPVHMPVHYEQTMRERVVRPWVEVRARRSKKGSKKVDKVRRCRLTLG